MLNRLSQNRFIWWGVALLVIGVPWLVSATLLSRYNMTWRDLTPSVDSDETYYWHQAASFMQVGFAAGYYTVDEQPAAAAWTPYYAWGPFVPTFYGTLGRLFGWQPYSMPVYNLAILSLGLIAFIALTRPPLIGLMLLGALIATYSPLLIFHTVSMLPVMELGLGLAAAGLFYWHFQRPRLATLAVVTVVITLFALIRSTWAFVFLPLFLTTAYSLKTRQLLLYVILGAGLTTAMWAMFFILGAPYPNRLSIIIRIISQDVLAGLELWARSSVNNIRNINTSYEAAIVMRWVGIGLIAALSAELIRQRAKLRSTETAAHVYHYILCIAILFMLFALAIFAYEVAGWLDFRILSPFVLMTAALMIALRRWHWASLVLITMIVTLPFSARGHNSFIRSRANPDIQTAYVQWQQQLEGTLIYNPDAESRWCNTLLLSLPSSEQFTIVGAVPAGIGLSFFFNLSRLPTIRSQWVILDDNMPAPESLQRVLDLPSGGLYRNLESACETAQTAVR
ncbi:hypothetical protein VZO05_00170 [Aggregatilineales bacterium SYSU G02658]